MVEELHNHPDSSNLRKEFYSNKDAVCFKEGSEEDEGSSGSNTRPKPDLDQIRRKVDAVIKARQLPKSRTERTHKLMLPAKAKKREAKRAEKEQAPE